MRIICFFIKHRWTKWKYIKAVGRYDEMLSRKCLRCEKIENYKGLTEYNHKGEKIPFNENATRY